MGTILGGAQAETPLEELDAFSPEEWELTLDNGCFIDRMYLFFKKKYRTILDKRLTYER